MADPRPLTTASLFPAPARDTEAPHGPVAPAPGPVPTSVWEDELSRVLGRTVRVRYGRSRTAPVVAREPTGRELCADPALRGGRVVRLHALFARAPREVRAALGSWLRAGRRARRASRELDAWLDAALADLAAEPERPASLHPSGRHHDLHPMATDLIAERFPRSFGGDLPAPGVTWGRRARSTSRGRLILGSFQPRTRVIRVHPVLDQEAVPPWFVRTVLHHELLHAVLPATDRGGRRRHHDAEFRRLERAFPDHARAQAWETRHVGALVRSARSGRPLGRRILARTRAEADSSGR